MVSDDRPTAAEPRGGPDADDPFGPLAIGARIGKYEIVEVLGQGGFGITYLARDTQLRRDVAVKEYLPTSFAKRQGGSTVLPRSTHVSDDFLWGRERFLDEARTLATLEDAPGIVDVYDFMEANGTAYMVMALVRGETVEARIKRDRRLPQPTIELLLYPLLDGLELVHAAGFLHRDIKPANILIDTAGRPVLIDFGASRAALQGRTQALTAVYTPGYAAYEQSTSAKQGPATDIYALCATLYHCVTGTPPPAASDRMMDDDIVPAVEAGKGRYAPSLLAAIDAGLKLRASERPQTIADLRRVLSGHGAGAVAGAPAAATREMEPVAQTRRMEEPAPRAAAAAPKRSRVGLIAAGVAALALAAGGGWYATRPAPAPEAVSVEETLRRAEDEQRRQAAVVARLREEEAKRKAEEEQRLRIENARRQAEEDEKRRIAEEARQRIEAEAARKAAEEKAAADAVARRKAEEEAKVRAEAEAVRKAAADKAAAEEAERQRVAAAAEAERRRAAEEVARRAAAEEAERRRIAAEASRKVVEERAAIDAAARRKAEDEAKARAEVEAARRREEEARIAAEEKAKAERLAQEKALAEAKTLAEAEAARKVAEEKAAAEAAERRKAEETAKSAAEIKKQAEAAEVALRLSEIDRKRVQVALTSLGHNTGGSDGAFGPRSRAMIAAWQKSRNETDTGYLTAPQFTALRTQAAPAIARWDEEQKKEEEAKRKAEEEAKRLAEEKAKREEEERKRQAAAPPPAQARPAQTETPLPTPGMRNVVGAQPPAAAPAPAQTAAAAVPPGGGTWRGFWGCVSPQADTGTFRHEVAIPMSGGRGSMSAYGSTITLEISGTQARFRRSGVNKRGQDVSHSMSGVVNGDVMVLNGANDRVTLGEKCSGRFKLSP
ncbi:MAG: protein kinase [Rhodospirillales bacterium]|nr:MAG: protein kinase [Rhodospirillales bacterium]